MRLPKNIISQDLTVERLIPGRTNPDTGQWEDATTQIVARVKDGSIAVKSGSARATAVQTVYDSDFVVYIGEDNISFYTSGDELKRGDIVIDSRNRRYTIVFTGHWGPIYAAELKEIIADGN